MAVTSVDVNQIEDVLTCTLSQPPSRVGCRLQTEQVLADVLGMSRWRLRSTLNRLESRGFLTRRRGSGTYVRKLPGADDYPATVQPLDAALLFVEESAEQPTGTGASPAMGQSLQVGFVCDLGSDSHTSRSIHAAVIRRLNNLGHRVIVHSTCEVKNRSLSDQDFLPVIQEQPCDAFIVEAEVAEAFLGALASSRQQPHQIFFGAANRVYHHQPIITFDGPEAVERAIHLFRQQGIERIAMIHRWHQGLPQPWKRHAHRVETYYRAMAYYEHDYSQVCCVDSPVPELALDAMRVTEQMVKSDRPDALFVTDDHLLPGVLEALHQTGCEPGKDIALITAAIRGETLPEPNISCLEFDTDLMGQMIVDTLQRQTQIAGLIPNSIALGATWRPGRTHMLART